MSGDFEQIRLLEALLFASAQPLRLKDLQRHFPEDAALEPLLDELMQLYANRGVNLVRVGDAWAFRTATDLAPRMTLEQTVTRKLSRAAVETLAIVAYHQPITRAEIEEIRGVAISKGTLDVLLEAGWIRPRGRRRTPGRPVTWGTTASFLDHFGLESTEELPGIEELKAAGLLDKRPALTALSSRGMLTEITDADDTSEEEDEDEIDESEIDMAVAEDFGSDIEMEDEEEADAGEELEEPASEPENGR
ncbi:SMC-Scp complex subunit ScpB [Limibacillus halophilus]